MNKPMSRKTSGFTLIEMLIVVTILAVLAGVGFNYYSESIEDARISTIKTNLKIVRDAISRYFKDHMTYPTSLESLQGAYLMQPVAALLETPFQNKSIVWVEVPTAAAIADPNRGPNIFQLSPASDCEWIDYDFGGGGSGGRQIRSIRIKYDGIEMNW
ncbi:MAG: prepilin-type N-terminal cleavage/methylation domain-containing protein [Candidatus Riflebacteria bacterium]|nr:prepilin-type N-terminal cleavage/methylation domain-containing protein [Candidatus Riflebacteria bacterium]